MINDVNESFKGYCFPKENDLWHTPAVNLNGAEEAVRYANLQKGLFHEVRIVGEDEKTVLQTIKGEIVYPILESVLYHFCKIGDVEYKVCNKCDAVGLSNFECPNCRKAMRKGAGDYMNSILDAIDERQGTRTCL